MWHAHFLLLEREPNDEELSRVVDEYQLWRENRTGLYFLTAHAKKLGKRPNFAKYLEWSVKTTLDLGFLEEWVASQKGTLDVFKYQIGYELIQQAATLSSQLGMSVLAAEDTDEDWGEAAFVKEGELRYLRFRTNRDIGDEYDDNEDTSVNVVFTPDTGFEVTEKNLDSMYAVPEIAIAEVKGVNGLDLVSFAEDKPTHEQAKKELSGSGHSVSEYLDSFGSFKRLRHAPPQRSATDKLRGLGAIVLYTPLIPFLLAGMFVYAVFFNYRSDENISEWKMILLGLAVLALPLWGVFSILRAIGGAIL